MPCPQVKEQAYCSEPKCQAERKRRWHRRKLAEDFDYRENLRDCQKRWRETHPDYWRNYRLSNPEYVKKNRQRQRKRNLQYRSPLSPIAKMDASIRTNSIIPGRYQLVPLGVGMIAKMDAINVEIRFVPRC
jgi:hypothetical protein